jgi:hypothetical protein
MMASSSNADGVDLERIRHALQTAKSRQAGGAGQDTVFMTLAVLFNDLEDALEMGVTQSDVLAILARHGMKMPRSRFSKYMYMLHQVVERRERPKAEPDMLKAGMVAEELKGVTPSSAPSDEPRRRRPQVKPKRQNQVDPVKAPDKVLAVAQALVGLSLPGASPKGLAQQLRASLGPGWTIKTAVQFGRGSNYASWMQAHWPEPRQRDLVVLGHGVAMRIADAMGQGNNLPDVDQMLRIAQAASDPSTADMKVSALA